MAEDYTQIPDLILEDYDELPQGKPRPAPPRPKPRPNKKPRQPIKPPTLPYGLEMKDVVDSIMGRDPQSLRRQEIQRATAEYESKQIKYPEPHKFVPKKGPPIRDLAAEEAQFEQLLRGAEKRIDRERYEAKLAGQTAPGTTQQLVNRFGRGYVGSMTSMLKGPTLLNPNARTDPTTSFLYQAPEQQEQMLQTLLPINRYDKSFHMRAAEALGGSVPFLMGGAAGRAVGMPGWLMSSVLGAASNAGSTYDDAIANGADEQSARLSSIVGALIGMTEGLGMGRMQLPGASKAAFATPLMQRLQSVLGHVGREGVEEWAQETGSSILNNVNAKVLSGYDPKRAIQEGLWEAGLMGFTTGGLMGGAMKGATGVMNAMDPEYRAAKQEYMQVQMLDKAFKKFMTEQEALHAAAANKGTPARIPPPPGYTAPAQAPKAPVGRAVPMSDRMAPMADMALMSQEKSFDEEMDDLIKTVEQGLVGVQNDSSEKLPDKSLIEQVRQRVPGLAQAVEEDLYATAGRTLTDQELSNEIVNAINGFGSLGESDLSHYLRELFPEEAQRADIKKQEREKTLAIWQEMRNDEKEGMTEGELELRDAEALEAVRSLPFRSVSPEDREINRARFLEGSKYQTPFYHGTNVDIETFGNMRDIGFHFGSAKSAEDRINLRFGSREYGEPNRLVPKTMIGSYWLNVKNPLRVPDLFKGGDPISTALNLVKEGHVEETQTLQDRIMDYKTALYAEQRDRALQAVREEVIQQLEAKGYDGLEYENLKEDPGSISVAVFRPEQIKSTTGNTGEFNPNRPEVYRSQEITSDEAKAIDSMAFDVIPGAGGDMANAPYMLIPRWAMTAMGEPFSTKGINWPYTKLGTLLAQFRKGAPSPEHAKIATQALYELAEHTIDQGLNSLTFIPHGQTDEAVRGTIEHETFHAAMRAGLAPKLDWIRNYPGLKEILNRPRTKEIQRGNKTENITLPSLKESILSSKRGDDALMALAFEIPAHTVQGRLDLLGMSPSEGIDFLFDLYNHLRTEYGPEGIARLRSLVRLRPEMLEAFDLAQSMWETWNQELRNGEGLVEEDVLYLDEEPMMGDNVVVAGAVDMGVFRVVDDSGDGQASIVGPKGIVHMAKKSLKKVGNWLNTKKGKEVLEKNPPAPTVPEEVPTGPPPPPRDPGGGASSGGGDYSSIYKEHLSPEAVQLLARTYLAVLKEGGIEGDPTMAPFIQVVAAINDGKLHNVYIDEVMEREGIPLEEFARSMEETASDAGKTLQAYSEIARFWNTIIDEWEISEGLDEGGRGKPTGGKAGPRIGGNLEAMYRAVPVDIRVRRALRGVHRTALGKNLWQRSGNVTQKAMLTQLSTFAVNSMTSLGQLPLRTVTYGLGGWMFQMMEGKGSMAQRFALANEDMLAAMRASSEVWFAMNPWQFAQWAKGQGSSTKFQQYQQTIHQLETIFPDIKKKLFALSTGTETLKAGKRQLLLAQRLVPYVKDNAKRDQLLKDIKVFEDRLEANGKAFGQLLNKTEVVYDFFLQPMQIAEYFLRRPMFVGQLTLELKREGLNLSHILAANQLSSIPEATMERAVNRALEFTYAYMPGTATGTNYAIEHAVETASMKAIEWLNRWGGPLNALFGEAFAKAAFNGAKFVYEYSPVGGILPANRITKNWDLTQTVAQRNSYAWAGNTAAADQIEAKGTYIDPVTNTMRIANPTNQEDYDRLAKAMVGSLMYAAVYFLRSWFGGPEWWQIDLGKKGPDGNPVYIDMRRHKPFSTLFQVVDLVERIRTGKLGDIDVPAMIGEIVAGIRIYDNQMGGSIIESTADWFRHDEHQGTANRAQEEIGKAMAVYFTPLINLRDCIAQWSEEENVKKDTRGSYNVMGPVMDKIPFLRRLLPNLTSPVEKSPIEMSRDPLLAQLTGYKTVEGQNFAGREWRRLGLYNRSFIARDSDPKINRAMNEAFEKMVGELAAKFEKDPAYQAANDKQKLMLWELFIGGDGGFASMAREIGLIANPKEMLKRSMEQGSGMGRFTKDATGYKDLIKKTFEEK